MIAGSQEEVRLLGTRRLGTRMVRLVTLLALVPALAGVLLGARALLCWGARRPLGERLLSACLAPNRRGEVMPLLLLGADPNYASTWRYRTPLLAAIASGDLPLTRTLLAWGGNPNLRGVDVVAVPLVHAADYAHPQIVELLCNSGADVNAPGAAEPPIALAAQRRDIESVRILLAHGANPNWMPGWSAPPLAELYGTDPERLVIAQLLLEHGADPDQIDADGFTVREGAKLWKDRPLLRLFPPP